MKGDSMLSGEEIKKQLAKTLKKTDFKTGSKYQGKVRDNYTIGNRRIIISTDRISAFDVVLDTIPFKGQVLNQLAEFWFRKTASVASHFIESPDPNVMVAKLCRPFPVEVVVRGYITGSLWREYKKGQDNYGLNLPKGMKKDQKLEAPVITPSTKAAKGHDMPLKREDVLKLMPEKTYSKIEKIALRLFARGSEIAARRGLMLVDTKYEFGMFGDEVLVIDEIHTPDSSRFWIKDTYDELFARSAPQQMLDKEYVRQWLASNGFTGNGTPPKIPDEVKIEAAKRYIELYELVTGMEFIASAENASERIRNNLKGILN